MSMRRMMALQAGLLLVTMFANATSRTDMMRIQVLDSATRSVSFDNNGVPLNCDQLTFDAYCRSSRVPQMINTLLVQEGNDPPFRVSCTMESKLSRCAPLPTGASFDARREKKGITVYYVDDKGRARKQFYAFVDKDAKFAPPAAAAAIAVAAHPVPDRGENDVRAPAPQNLSPHASNADPNAAPPGPGWVRAVNPEKVRCNFSSTPAGAEITLDGLYVGNTPSEISIPAGTHTVAFTLPGFAEWKRELLLSSGSEPTVSTVLQKLQQ
jgi:PEGA domain